MNGYADLLGFLGLQGKEPDLTADGLQRLSETGLELIHCTSAPPYSPTLEVTIEEHQRFVGAIREHQGQGLFTIVDKKQDLHGPGVKIICGLQHCPVKPENTGDIVKLSEAGIRVMQITFGKATPYEAVWMTSGD